MGGFTQRLNLWANGVNSGSTAQEIDSQTNSGPWF
jgi:hypothetical protein